MPVWRILTRRIVGFLQILHNFTVVLLQILQICSFAGGTSAEAGVLPVEDLAGVGP